MMKKKKSINSLDDLTLSLLSNNQQYIDKAISSKPDAKLEKSEKKLRKTVKNILGR